MRTDKTVLRENCFKVFYLELTSHTNSVTRNMHIPHITIISNLSNVFFRNVFNSYLHRLLLVGKDIESKKITFEM